MNSPRLRNLLTFTAMLSVTSALVLRSSHPGMAQDTPPKGQGQGFGDIPAALKADPGCIGVETARTSSGKMVVFAWFKNKKATQNWYYSQPHQGMMKMMGNAPSRKPLADVKDDKTPIMVIASITPAAKPDPNTHLPVSQIAIEMYAPVVGGFANNGRFAPDEVKVPGLTVYKAPK